MEAAAEETVSAVPSSSGTSAPATDELSVPKVDAEAAIDDAVRAPSGPNPAEAVIRTFVEALAKLARSHRDAVREAGGIAPLVTLLRSGSSEIQGLAAAVLRDLATDNPANRNAILKAGGLNELVEMVRSDATRPSAGEAAGALRALSSEFPQGCKAICSAGGIEALIEMVRCSRGGAQAPIHATGVLANIAQASEVNCEAILKLGGVEQLVGLFSKDEGGDSLTRRRVPPELKQWMEKASEEAANALWQLAAKAPSCNAAIREANAIGPLVVTLLRSGLDSATANYSAKALIELIQSDEASKMVALDAIANAAKAENFDGHGWSLSYPLLRHLLQGAAERVLLREQEGTSTSGIAYAIDIAKAVEFPQKRIDEARLSFDESQARQKREKLAATAEARRIAKQEEAAARTLAREEAERKAEEAAKIEAEAAGNRGRSKRRDSITESPTESDARRGGRRADGENVEGGHGSGHERRKPPLPSGARSGSSSARLSRSDSLPRRSSSARGSPDANPLGGLPSGRRTSSSKRSSRKGGSYQPVEVRPLHREVPLHFIPRAQLLEKIERIAAMSQAEMMPRTVVSTEATEMWHHRWDQKYQAGLPFAPEAGAPAPASAQAPAPASISSMMVDVRGASTSSRRTLERLSRGNSN